MGDLGWLLANASYALASEIAHAFAPLEITPRAFHVLEAAVADGVHTQSELAEMVGLDKTTMVVTVDALEAAGLARRRPSQTDRRARVIVVTDAGRQRIAAAREVIEAVQADVLASLPADRAGALLETLATLVRGRLSERIPCSPPLRRRQPR
ncbi:MAG: MarR family transcriptional regulator [Solirubrobacterales bacterium]